MAGNVMDYSGMLSRGNPMPQQYPMSRTSPGNRMIPGSYRPNGQLDVNSLLARLGPNLGGRGRSNMMGIMGQNPLTGAELMGDMSKTPAQRLFGSSGADPNFIDKLAYIVSGKTFHPSGGVTQAPYGLPIISSQGAPFYAGGSAIPAMNPIMDPNMGSTNNLEDLMLLGEDLNMDFMSPWEI